MEFNQLVILLVIWGVVLTISSRAITRMLDKRRIKLEIQFKGGKVESVRWTPYAKGRMGMKNERLYEVIWADDSGVKYQATAKTAMLDGNYFADVKRGNLDIDMRPHQHDSASSANNQHLKQ